MVPLLQIGRQTITSTDLVPLLTQYNLLPQLVREVLIDQTIATISLSEEDFQQACQAFYKSQQIEEPAALQQWLKQTGLSEAQVLQIATRPLRLQRFKEQQWGHTIESDFLTHKAQFDQVIYSLLRSSHLELLQELFFRIEAGEQSFAELARDHSEGPEANTGGLLGPVPITQPHPAIANQLKSCQPGQLLPPLKIGDWYVLIRLEKRMSAQLDDATRQRLLDQRFEEYLKAQLQQAPQIQPTATPTISLT